MTRPGGPTHDEPTATGAEPDAPSSAPVWPGAARVLAGRYQLEDPIESGGAAVVWRAHDQVLNRSVAVKLLHPHLATDTTTVERFRREAVAAAQLSHPNVVAIYDTGQEGDAVYLVMEYVDGPSLRTLLAEQGGFEPDVVAALGEQVASALGEAHAQGLVHRDVKPGNILLSSDGDVKVADFGIAKALNRDDTLTSPGTVVGTAAYLAPEQLEGDAVDARADVYALGVLLYECLTGQPAFQGDTPTATAAQRLSRDLPSPRSLRADVPRGLDGIVTRALARSPQDRYADGKSMAAALAALVPTRPSELTASLLAETGLPRPEIPNLQAAPGASRPVDTNRRLLLAFLGGLLLALALFLGTEALRDDRVPAPPNGLDTLPVVAALDFDPHGDPPQENRAAIGNAHDGDPSTAWRTETYRGSSHFGDLKPGVGIWFDLGQARTVTGVEFHVVAPGFSIELYAADSPQEDLVGWGPRVLSARLDTDPSVVPLAQPARGRYWLVWITELADLGEGRYQAGFFEVRFRGN